MRWTLCAAAAAMSMGTAALAAPATKGAYVEARTCNVYTGACHANGEAVTVGREAILAWRFDEGAMNGLSVAGRRVVAVVTSDENLGRGTAPRRTVLYVDSGATDLQQSALAAAIRSHDGAVLGEIVAVRRAPIEFRQSGLQYTVRVPGTACVQTTRFACDHCVMPHQVWYEPFVPLADKIVASASVNEFRGDAAMRLTWRSVDETSSFVGEFRL